MPLISRSASSLEWVEVELILSSRRRVTLLLMLLLLFVLLLLPNKSFLLLGLLSPILKSRLISARVIATKKGEQRIFISMIE